MRHGRIGLVWPKNKTAATAPTTIYSAFFRPQRANSVEKPKKKSQRGRRYPPRASESFSGQQQKRAKKEVPLPFVFRRASRPTKSSIWKNIGALFGKW
jgi:hypothetical protein